MSAGSPATGVLELVWEFARAEQAGDLYGYRLTTQEYLLRTPGGGFESSRFAWDAQLRADLEALRHPGRDPALLPKLGEILRRFLLPLCWSEQEAQILAAVAASQPVLLTIRSAAAELFALPWELVVIKSTGQHLGELPGVLVRHEWPDTRSTPPSQNIEGGRILFAWSAAAGKVPAVEHAQAIERACHSGGHAFDPTHDVIGEVSCGRLLRTLEEARRTGRPITVLHILCHGAPIGSTFGLTFDGEDPSSGPALVDAGRLRQLLKPHAEMLRLIVLCACDSGNGGALDNQMGSVAQTLHRMGIAAVVASRYPLSISGSIRLAEVLYRELVAGSVSLEQSLLTARSRLAEDAEQLDWASVELYARSADGVDTRPISFRPYRGLQSFQPEHQRFFFGRDREIRELTDRLRTLRDSGQPRLLAVDGASASGKSSVVLAGALSELLHLNGETTWIVRRTPGPTPLRALADLPSDRPLLLIIDPLDDLFTATPHTPEGRKERSDFVRRLWALASASAPDPAVSVVLTIRSDLIGRCGELLLEDGRPFDSVLYQPAHRCSIGQLGRAELRAIIEKPAAVVGLELESGLCERMLSDVESEPGALPLLADALDALWRERRGRTLTQEAYDALGGIAGALTGRADQLIATLAPDELRVARQLLMRLVAIEEEGGQRTRRRVTTSAARPNGSDAERFDAVLARLCAARLIVRGQGNGKDTAEESLELVHEVLLRRWQRLREWLDAEKDWLQKQARLQSWAKEHSEHGALLRGHQLEAALEMTQGRREQLSAAVIRLLDESQLAREREEEQAKLARDSRRVLLAAQLAFDPTRAVAILREVESRDATRVPGWLSRVTNLLHRQCFTRRELEGHKGSICSAVWLPESPRALTVSTDGTLRMWNAQEGTLLGSSSLPAGRVLHLHAGTNADKQPLMTMATLATEHGVQLWTVDPAQGHHTPGRLISVRTPVAVAVFSAGGRSIAIGTSTGEIQLAPTHGQAEPTPLLVPKGKAAASPAAVTALCFSSDGHQLASATRDGSVRLWDLRGKEPPRLLMKQLQDEDAQENEDTSAPTALAFHPGGLYLAIGQALGGVRVLRRDGAYQPLLLSGHDYRVTSLSWSHDGRLLVSTSTDGAAVLWGACVPTRQVWLWGHRGDVNHAAFSDNGASLITSGSDGIARVWELAPEPQYAATRLAPGEKIPPSYLRCFERTDTDFDKSAPTELCSARSSDGTRSARSDATGTVVVSEHARTLLTVPGEGGPVTALGFSADGSKLAIARRDRAIRVIELATGKKTLLTGHHDACHSLAWSPDGTLLATGGIDFTARLWRLAEKDTPCRVLVHDGAVTLVRFNESGTRLLTASESDGLWLWELDGTRLPLFDADREEYCLAVRSDLGACITEDTYSDSETPEDGERFEWQLDLDAASLLAYLWRGSPICLSAKERSQLLGESEQEAARNYERSLARVREAVAAPKKPTNIAAPPPPTSWDGPALESEDDSE